MIHVVVTSARVAAGLMTVTAWDVLRGAERVVSHDVRDPIAKAVAAAGVKLSEVPEISSTSQHLQLLRSLASPEHDVVWLAPSGDGAADGDLSNQLLAEIAAAPDAEIVHGSYDLPGAGVIALVAVMDRLRADCPWDREQTHLSLARYLVEEAYETLEAIETGDRSHLREELGDLLLQAVFHARLAAEHPEDPWDIDDVARGVVTKLVHRHPHVFAGLDVADAAQVEANWDRLKAQEKQRSSVLAGVPTAMPALGRAEKLLRRAATVGLAGVDVPVGEGAVGVLGDALFDLARRAQSQGLDPEQALREAIGRFSDAVHRAANRT